MAVGEPVEALTPSRSDAESSAASGLVLFVGPRGLGRATQIARQLLSAGTELSVVIRSVHNETEDTLGPTLMTRDPMPPASLVSSSRRETVERLREAIGPPADSAPSELRWAGAHPAEIAPGAGWFARSGAYVLAPPTAAGPPRYILLNSGTLPSPPLAELEVQRDWDLPPQLRIYAYIGPALAGTP